MTAKLNSTFKVELSHNLHRSYINRVEQEVIDYVDSNEQAITEFWIKDDNNKTYSGAFEVVAKSKTTARSYVENVKQLLGQMGRVTLETEEGE